MEGAQRIILEEGSLAQALQATIAIPGVFPPVEVDGQLLADGGLLNNLPTDVVKDLGADIVIAVDVGTPLSDRESLASFLGVLNQSIGVMMIENVRQNLLLADIIVSPDLQDYTSMDFSAGPAIVDLGYRAAESKRVFLEALKVNDTQWEQYQGFKSSRRREEAFRAEFLELAGPSQRGQEEIRRSLEENIGAELQTAALESDLNALYSRGRYRALSYRGITREQEGLLVEVTPKSHGPPFIDLGFEINGADIDNIRFGVRSRTTFWMWVLMDLNGEWTWDWAPRRLPVLSTTIRSDGDFSWHRGHLPRERTPPSLRMVNEWLSTKRPAPVRDSTWAMVSETGPMRFEQDMRSAPWMPGCGLGARFCRRSTVR